MSRKTNLNTIRGKFSQNLYNFNSRFYLLGLNSLKAFKQLLLKKSVLLCFENLNFCTNKIVLNGSIFFKSNQLKFYKKHKTFLITRLNKTPEYLKKENFLENAFHEIRTTFSTSLIVYNFKVLNTVLKLKLLIFLFKNLKLYAGQLFSRRFNLFLDFIKITSLFVYSEVDTKTFLYFLTEIFKFLRKKNHSRFFSFLKTLFFLLISESKLLNLPIGQRLGGFKLLIKGRLKGKPMASSLIITESLIPSQTLSASVEFSKAYTFTQNFGVFGFKLWVYKY
jgi:hypothetical protein